MKKTVQLEDAKRCKLHFNGHAHNIVTIFGQTTPTQITVDLADIARPVNDDDTPNNTVLIDPPSAELNSVDAPLVLYKFDRKWVVLTGQGHVDAAKAKGESVVTGILISSPALKRCRIQQQPLPESAPASNETLNRGYRPEHQVRNSRPYEGNKRYGNGR